MTKEEFHEFRDAVEPELFSAGWVRDPRGPKVRLFSPLPPVRLVYREPSTGLYYGLRDAMRVAAGEQPKRAGVRVVS